MDNKPLIVFGFIIATLIAIIVFLIGLAAGVGISGDLKVTEGSLSAWVSALATLCIAILTIFLAKESWSLRALQQEQIEDLRKEALRPNVELYLESNRASFQFMDVHIENNGNGSAREMHFSLQNMSENAQEGVGQKVIEKLESLSMFSRGMAALGAGKRRSSFVFSFIDLVQESGDAAFGIKIEITVDYKDAEDREYSSVVVLDFSEYQGIIELGGGDPAYQTYQELKKIREIFEGFAGGMSSKRLKVDTWTSKDREEQKRGKNV